MIILTIVQVRSWLTKDLVEFTEVLPKVKCWIIESVTRSTISTHQGILKGIYTGEGVDMCYCKFMARYFSTS